MLLERYVYLAMLWIRMFLGLPDPYPSINKQKGRKTLISYILPSFYFLFKKTNVNNNIPTGYKKYRIQQKKNLSASCQPLTKKAGSGAGSESGSESGSGSISECRIHNAGIWSIP
jgi:hypothetical protein